MKKAKKKMKKARGGGKPQRASKSRSRKVGGPSVPTTVCSNGTINQTDGEITFVNGTSAACTITSCELPGWPAGLEPIIPAAQNGILGEVVIPLTSTPALGSYEYTSSCCSPETPPIIIVV